MERRDYDILVDRYEQMRKRFIDQKKIGWLMLLMVVIVAVGCAATTGINIIWDICSMSFCAIVVLASVCTNGKLLFNKNHFTVVDMAIYCLVNVGGLMGILVFLFTGIIADQSLTLAIAFFVIELVIYIGFWITTSRYNQKKLHEGGFNWRKRTLETPRKIWIWGVTAIPFIPIMTLFGRRRWLSSLENMVQIILLMYMLLWLWLILIYLLFAPSLLFIKLERKRGKKEDD